MSRAAVGFSMHPLWAFGEALPGFLDPLQAAGLRALEFELWDGDPNWPRFRPLMDDCRRMGFRLCFHAPYRGEYNVVGFAGERRAALEDAHAALLDVAASYGSVTVVVHGARSETRSRDALYADSVAYLRWGLDRYPSLVWALENLGPKPGTTKIGTERDEVLRVVEEVGHPRLGLCWDVGHDVLADRLSTPSTAWLRRVVHVHAHDVDEGGRDHYPLLYARVPYDTWLPALRATGFQGIVTLEIKGNQLRGRDPSRIHRTLIESVATIDRLLTAPASPADGREPME